MNRRTIAMLAGTALVVSACGSTAPAIVNPRPAAPVNLTVFIDSTRVSVSPANVGAGPVEFIITNQAAQTESLAVLPAGASAGQPLANTGPINPQGTAQVTVNFSRPGSYSVATGNAGGESGSTIQAAVIHVGHQRSSSDNELLQP
jgi:hypothetical protein